MVEMHASNFIRRFFMVRKSRSNQLFHEYFEEWIEVYKEGAIREVSLQKYYITHKHLKRLIPDLKIINLTRREYQLLLNRYAHTHEKQTTMDFHHQVKGAILDAVDEGLIPVNPTRKIIIKGIKPREKKQKFLNQFEVQLLLKELNLEPQLNWDWFLLLICKTGIRYSEALAITPDDFDFSKQILTINKTWNYKKTHGGFEPTKNVSSNRKIQLDWQTAMQFSQLVKELDNDYPIFIKGRPFNSTINNRLKVICRNCDIPMITVHSLRHTHASLLLYAGVSIATVAKRLGHSYMNITQKTYLHIINELESKDNDKIMSYLANLI